MLRRRRLPLSRVQMLDENTVRKFSILGGKSEYMPKLLAVMDKKDIPSFLGGDDESCTFIAEQGPGVQHFPTTRGPWMNPRPDAASGVPVMS